MQRPVQALAMLKEGNGELCSPQQCSKNGVEQGRRQRVREGDTKLKLGLPTRPSSSSLKIEYNGACGAI